MAAIEEFLADCVRRMDGSIEHTRTEFNSVRTGRASTALLDRITIDYYGTPTPLSNMATIGAPEPRLLSVQPYDPTQIKAIEKAIMESDLGLTPSNDGKLIRLPIPSLTEERRRGTSGADRVELVVRRLDRLVHAPLRIREEVLDGSHAPSFRGSDDRADALARGHPADVPLRELEDVDRQPVVHAQGECRRVHDLEAALDRLQMGQLGDELRGRVLVRVAVVHALDAVLRHQDRLRADLERAQRRGRVGREERVAGAGREDHHPPLLQVADRAAPDVRLGDLGDRDRGLGARVDAELLERVLQRERVQERGEHPRVVGGRPVHALGGCRHPAVDVPGADDDRELGAGLVNCEHLLPDRVDGRGVDPVLAAPEQRFAGELQEGAPEARPLGVRRSFRDLVGARAHERASRS